MGVARALLVKGERLSAAAAAHEMSAQQANVVRERFLAKVEKYRLDAFMAREKPKLATAALEPYSRQMHTLLGSGYTNNQIVAFLRDQGIETSETIVRKFFKEHQP